MWNFDDVEIDNVLLWLDSHLETFHDYNEPKIPEWTTLPYIPPIDTGTPYEWARAVADLRTLIDEFRRALEAAKTVDRLTGQPDCVDPEKAKLEERVARLEAELERYRGGAVY